MHTIFLYIIFSVPTFLTVTHHVRSGVFLFVHHVSAERDSDFEAFQTFVLGMLKKKKKSVAGS